MPAYLTPIFRPHCQKCKSFATQELRNRVNARVANLCEKHAAGGLASYKANVGEDP